MSRNGSGIYNLPTNSWNPAVNGNSATAADWQSLIDDVESALTQSVSSDGQTPITGNLNLNGNKITSLGTATSSGDALRFQQLFSQGVETDIASGATVDIGAQNTNFLCITGTNTITSFGTNYNGPRFLRFAGALTLTHSASLVLPGGANITTAAGDGAIVVPLGTPAAGWRVIVYSPSSGYVSKAGDTMLGPLVLNADPAAALGAATKQYVDTAVANATATGAIDYFPATTAPAGYVKANGALLSRTTYTALWAYAQASGNLAASDGAWDLGKFSPGDGSTTFRIPDMRGEFPRGWDDGKGADSGRAIGTSQGDAIRNITGLSMAATHPTGASGSSPTGAFYNSGHATVGSADLSNRGEGFDASRVVPTAAENRPRNVALLACIKF